MMKTSIFVEGYTELAFVREFLLRYHEYMNIDIHCVQIISNQYSPTNYSFPNEESFFDEDNGNHKYFIIDCCGDQITSKILKREPNLIKASYSRIIGLRDVYSEVYRKHYAKDYDPSKVEQFISDLREVFNVTKQTDIPELHFSIMEIEAWYLGMKKIFQKKSALLTPEKITEYCGKENSQEIFHPANVVGSVFGFVGDTYKKREGQSDSLSNYPDIEHFRELYLSQFCDSFNAFCHAIGITFE